MGEKDIRDKVVCMHQNVTVADILDVIVGMDYYDILEIIQQIDTCIADWDFTLSLHKYFKEKKKQYKNEEGAYGK